jgi:hypothetical protein
LNVQYHCIELAIDDFVLIVFYIWIFSAMTNTVFALFSFLLLLTAARPPVEHDFHVSKCLMEYDEARRELQVTMHLFIDDLELALEQQGASSLFICTEKEDPMADTYIQRYLEQHLSVRLNEQPYSIQWIGKEAADDLTAVWCYLIIEEVPPIQSASIRNTSLMEIYRDQKNIIHFKLDKDQESFFLLEKGQAQKDISF